LNPSERAQGPAGSAERWERPLAAPARHDAVGGGGGGGGGPPASAAAAAPPSGWAWSLAPRRTSRSRASAERVACSARSAQAVVAATVASSCAIRAWQPRCRASAGHAAGCDDEFASLAAAAVDRRLSTSTSTTARAECKGGRIIRRPAGAEPPLIAGSNCNCNCSQQLDGVTQRRRDWTEREEATAVQYVF
jgi:hypothetical protein